MSNSKPVVGALVFESARYGHIMVSADVADNGDPCLEFMVPAHPQFLHPTTTKLRFRQGFNQYEALEKLTGEQVEAIARNIHDQAALFLPSASPSTSELEPHPPHRNCMCADCAPSFADDELEPLSKDAARKMVWSASSWLRSESVNEDDVLEVIAAVERAHGIGANIDKL